MGAGAGLRWGELAGLQVGDRVAVPGQGLRLQRSVLASSKGGGLFVNALKGKRFRVHDLRHTCASLWLGASDDPKVVQRILEALAERRAAPLRPAPARKSSLIGSADRW